ncbi:MAG: right-handed parallel beta-helix repeat-containing protein [Thermoplasmatales archaeon]|nr:MAG: right-handed parallel beta-helix repeat-containing protein [Thermoplasmatales archaeon]
MNFKKGLAIGIILLFISVIVIPSTGTVVEKSSLVSFDGKTLYVGGDGPGNYTKIQDAIDDASDGDTVFVYAYSSPYHENVKVDKSINLIGEDRDSTIIDGDEDVINISADWVNISGFTIKNSGDELGYGIKIDANYNTIVGNRILGNLFGVLSLSNRNNNISGNIISSNDFGICSCRDDNTNIYSNTIINNIGCGILIEHSDETEISRNYISDNYWGILLVDSQHDVITGNTIKNNKWGIEIIDSSDYLISRNNITNNQIGINLIWHSFGIVKENNFIENGRSVDYDIFFNRWIRNYWDDWDSLLPRPIKGKCTFVNLSLLLSDIFKKNVDISIPWVQFDWCPAEEPYDIGV